MGRTKFSIEDILKSSNNTNKTSKFLTPNSHRFSHGSDNKQTIPAISTDPNLLWWQLYWESFRRYYVKIQEEKTVQEIQTNAYVQNYFSKIKFLQRNHPYFDVRNSKTKNFNKAGLFDIKANEFSTKETKDVNGDSNFPSDSPLFELEKLATTKLSSWNSETCPIKSLLEKKIPRQSRRRKSRTAFTTNQLSELENVFRKQKYLTPTDRDRIANTLSLSSAQVITWFQNRRAKFKRDLEEMQNDLLYSKNIKKSKSQNGFIPKQAPMTTKQHDDRIL